MNEFSLGTTILRLRKEKGITQEELGGMIGVSAGAVSKWENGNSKPDIDLLSPLARALNTSLNELLSFKEELSENEVAKIHHELAEIFLHMGFEEGERKCREYLRKYPNSVGMKFTVAGLIQMYSMMMEDDSQDMAKEKWQYALSLLYEVTDSKDNKYSQNALFLISSIQMKLENYDESERCLKELSDCFVDPMVLYASLLEIQGKNVEAEDLCKKMLLNYLIKSIAMMSILSRIYKDTGKFDKSVLFLNAVNKIESMFKIGLCSGAYNLCKLYIREDKKKIAARWFNDYVDGLLSAGYDYADNPYFENLKLEVNTEGQKIIRKKLFQTLIDEVDLKCLTGISEYELAIEKLNTAVSEINTCDI